MNPPASCAEFNQLYQAGKYAEAIPIAERYVQVIEARHGKEGTEYALALNNLGELFRVTNRLAEAEPLLRRALAIDERVSGPEHPNVAVRLNNLGLLLKATNRLAEAEPLLRRALAINEKSFGPEHPAVAHGLSNLAQLLQRHQPASRGRAADASRACDRREELRTLSIPTSPSASTIWPSCCRTPTGWPRPSR